MSDDLPLAWSAICAVTGVTEADIRTVDESFTCYAYTVRLWNRRRLEVAAYDVERYRLGVLAKL